MMVPPDTLPDSFWEVVGYGLIVAGSVFVWWLQSRPQKRAPKGDRAGVIKEYLEEQIVALRDEMREQLHERDERISAIEDDLTLHRDYVEALSAMEEFTDPPFPSIDKWRRLRAS